MPYENRHYCQIRPCDDFKKGSLNRKEVQKGIAIVTGELAESDKPATQSFDYDKKTYSEEQAKKHCDQNNGLFSPAKKYLILHSD